MPHNYYKTNKSCEQENLAHPCLEYKHVGKQESNAFRTVCNAWEIFSHKKSFSSNNQHSPKGLISKFQFCVKLFRNAATTTAPAHPKLPKFISFVNKHISFL